MQSAASDLPLLEEAVREAGRYAHEWFGRPQQVRQKGKAGPVTEVDLAVDERLKKLLRAARPDYGWLSEETPDDHSDRLKHNRIFSLDPIDGTSAFIAGVPQYTICVGVIDGEEAVAGAVYNPATDELWLGARGHGATLNGAPIFASANAALEGARFIGNRGMFENAGRWPTPWPRMHYTMRQSIAYRLALVASGEFDATILFGPKNEWDIAAGAAIIEAAGGRFSDPWGKPIRFNQPDPRAPGAVASGAALHPLIIERTSFFTDSR